MNHRPGFHPFMIQGACIWLLVLSFFSFADMAFSVKPDRTKVSMGESIQVTATLIADQNLGNLRAPNLPSNNDFTVVSSDQNQSHSTSVQMINGKTKRSVQITYQFYYTIAPKRIGTFTFPALRIDLKGKKYASKAFPITVTKEAVSNPDVLARITISNRQLYVGEQAILSVKIAENPKGSVRITNEGFNTFLRSMEKTMGTQFSLINLLKGSVEKTQELIEGLMYTTYTIKYALFPLESGSFTLPRLPFEYQQLIRARRSRDPFDDFFGGSFFGSSVRATPKTVLANTLTIMVSPLPPSPSDFSGAVGRFSLKAEVSPRSVPTGEALTCKISIGGNTRAGNIGEVNLPKLPGFEIFTPEKHTYIDTSGNGIYTRKTYKYLIIPRETGEKTFPAITWTYFNPRDEKYTTLRSDPVPLSITKGKDGGSTPSRYLTQENIQELGRDIRYIKTPEQLLKQSHAPYRNVLFLILYPVPFLMLILSILYRIQMERRERDADKTIRRKAYRNTMKIIAQALGEKDLPFEKFLGRIDDSVHKYISGKFGFAATGMIKRDLCREIKNRGAQDETVQGLETFLEEVDSWRFSPGGTDESRRNDIAQKARELIDTIDRETRKVQKK